VFLPLTFHYRFLRQNFVWLVDNITASPDSPCSELAGCSFRWSCSGVDASQPNVRRHSRNPRAWSNVQRPISSRSGLLTATPTRTYPHQVRGKRCRMTPKPPCPASYLVGLTGLTCDHLTSRPQQRRVRDVASQHYAERVLIRIEAIQPRREPIRRRRLPVALHHPPPSK